MVVTYNRNKVGTSLSHNTEWQKFKAGTALSQNTDGVNFSSKSVKNIFFRDNLRL